MKPIFTFRQQEFARLYASGLPAAKAAISAGYAASTAETNAARLLQNPLVAAYIREHRAARRDVTHDQIQAVLARMLSLVSSDDEKVAMQAARVFVRLKEAQDRAGISPVNESALSQVFDKADKMMVMPETQNPDCQGQTQTVILLPDKVEETDTLPTGSPAFDVRLAPTRPETTKSPEPITIQFVPLTNTPYVSE